MVTVFAALPISIALMNVGLALAWAGALMARAPVHKTVGFWWGVAYAGWQVVSRLVGAWEGRDVGGGFGMMYTWTGLCLAQLAFGGTSAQVTRVRQIAMRLLLVTVTAAVLVALAQFVIGHKDAAKPLRIGADGIRFKHATGFFAIHLTYGVMMMTLIILALGGALESWSPWRWWGRVLAGIASFGMVLSMGRLAFAGMVIGVVSLVAASGRQYFRRAAVAGLVAVAVTGLLFALVRPERFAETLRLEDGRWPIWKTSVVMASQHPIVGVGSSRAFRIAYLDLYDGVNPTIPNEFPKGAPHAHNAPLALVAEHGIPTLMLWLAMLVVVLKGLHGRSLSHLPAWRTGIAMVLAFFTAGLFEHLAGDGESCHALWTLLGACLASAPDHDHA